MNNQRDIQISSGVNGSNLISGDHNVIIQIFTQHKEQIDDQPPPSIGTNPYKGLSAFHEQDSDRFFGREELTEILWKKYRKLSESDSAVRFMPILGPSGSGKSSVARAGLIPELARNPLAAMKKARVAVFVPGTHPIESLTNILERIVFEDKVVLDKVRNFQEKWRENSDTDGLRRIAHALPDIDTSPLVILVDQFEEIYSLCDDVEERRIFIENLLHAAKDKSNRVFVVMTLRSDFLTQTQTHPELSHIIALNSVIVPAMNEEQLRRAIAKPAEKAGHPIDKSTVDLLIEQSRDHEGVLPLLEFALTQIWNGMAKNIEPAETLKDIGGVGGALAKEAGRLFDALSDSEKRIAKRGFLALVRLGEGTKDTRRRVPMSEITPHNETPENVHKVLRKFSTPGARLITLSDLTPQPPSDLTPRPPSLEGKGGKSDYSPLRFGEGLGEGFGWGYAEITHEALFENWIVMKEWLNKSRDDIRFERRLSEAAGNWNENGKPAGLLWWQSPNLELLRRFYQKNQSEMTELQMAFYQASVKKDSMTKIQIGVVIAVVAGLTSFSAWAAVLAKAQMSVVIAILAGLTIFSVLAAIHARKSQKISENALEKSVKQKELAMQAVNTLTYRFVDKLKNMPQTQEVVEGVLQSNIDLLKKLYELNPEDTESQREKTVNLDRIGDYFLAIGNTEKAVQVYQESLEISKKLAADDPKNTQAQRDLSVSYNKLGDIQLKLGNTDAAITAYNQALEISKKLAADDPKNTQAQRDLSVSFEKLGDIQLQLGNTDAAITAYNQAVEIFKKLAADDPKNTQAISDLGISYSRIGNVQLKLGKTDEAMVSYQEYLKIKQKLAQDDPKNASAQRGLIISNWKMGDVQSAMKNSKAALQYYQQALSIAETLAAKDKLNKQAQDDLKTLKGLVEKLKSEL